MIKTNSETKVNGVTKVIWKTLRDEVINDGTSLVTDALMGNDLKEGLKRETDKFKERDAEGYQQLNQTRKRQTPKPKQKTLSKELGQICDKCYYKTFRMIYDKDEIDRKVELGGKTRCKWMSKEIQEAVKLYKGSEKYKKKIERFDYIY